MTSWYGIYGLMAWSHGRVYGSMASWHGMASWQGLWRYGMASQRNFTHFYMIQPNFDDFDIFMASWRDFVNFGHFRHFHGSQVSFRSFGEIWTHFIGIFRATRGI